MAALEQHQNNTLAPPAISDQGAALADWLAARGGACHPRVDLRRRRDDDVGGERSAVAAAPIAAGELLLRVPARCALRRGDEDALAAALDGILGDAEWAPYVATLPENPEVLDAWTRAERALLAGTGLAGAGDERSKRRRISARSARLVRSRAAQLDDGSWALVPGVDALNDGRGRAAPCPRTRTSGSRRRCARAASAS